MPYVGHNSSGTATRTLVVARDRPAAPADPARTNNKLMAVRGRGGRGAARRVSTRALAAYNDERAIDYYQGDLEGFSLRGLAKAIKKVASPVQKGLTAVGHAAGAAITSKVGQGLLGGALAFTGAGAVPAALIFGGSKAAGNLIKKGGNLKHAATGFAQGAVEGVASVAAGRAVRGAKHAITSRLAKRGAAAVVQHTAGGSVANDSSAIIDDILSKGVPAVADPIPQVDSMPTVSAAPLPDNSAAIAQAQAAIDAANRQAADAAAQAQAAQQQAQAAINAANQAAAQAQQQQTAAAQAAADQAAQQAAQAQANAQAQLDAAQQAAQAAAAAQAQQLAQRVSSSSAANRSDNSEPVGGGSPFDDGSTDFAHLNEKANQDALDKAAAQAAADDAAAKRSATVKKLVIAGGVLAGAAGVAVVVRNKRRKRGGRR